MSPKRSRSFSATITGSFAAPDSARRTVAKASEGASSKWAKATHIDGAPGIVVTRRERIDSSAVAGSKRWTSTTVAPADRLTPITTLSPKMWYGGITP